MKYFFSLILILALATGCKQKILSGKELEGKLKQTMMEHLNNTLRPGTAVTIMDMNYYPDKIKKYYICVFDVKVHSGNKDTTGTMKAFISNDFSKVERTQ